MQYVTFYPKWRLQAPEREKTYRRQAKIIYTKNLYSEGVKVKQWHELLEHHPIDVDPYCQGKVNYFVSHYHRLGTHDGPSYKTTTQDMLEQVFIKDKMVPDKLMNNYYTYNEGAECLTDIKEGDCPQVCADEFSTTMQHSYQMPHPYVMKRLAFPIIPYMQNRKYRHEAPDLSSEKFYGDNFSQVTCELQKHKSFRWSSFNPMTCTYTSTTRA